MRVKSLLSARYPAGVIEATLAHRRETIAGWHALTDLAFKELIMTENHSAKC
jgi:hypothetical protein